MNRRSLLQLRVAIPFWLMLFTLGGVVANTAFYVSRADGEVERSARQTVSTLMTQVQTGVADRLQADDRVTAKRRIAIAGLDPHVGVIMLVGDTGLIELSNRTELEGRPAEGVSGYSQADASAATTSLLSSTSGGPSLGRLDAYWPVSLSGTAGPVRTGGVGILYVSWDLTTELAAARGDALRQAGILSSTLVLAMLALYAVLELRITRRLSRMEAAMSAVASGEQATRADARGGDEISMLAESFNRMAAKLETEHQELQASEERFRLIAENSSDVIVRIADGGTIIWASPSLEAALGWPAAAWIGRPSRDFVYPDDVDLLAENRKSIASGDRPESFSARARIRGTDGEYRWCELRGRVYLDAEGMPDGLSFSFHTIDEEVAAERALQEANDALRSANAELDTLARTDVLTGLPNRLSALQHLKDEFARSRRTGRSYAVLLIDLDHFKRINDSYGHAVGDDALVRATNVMRRSLRESDILARFGGEEFIGVLPETDEAGALTAAEAVRAAVAADVAPWGGSLTLSVGVAIRMPTDADEMAAVARADACLYAAKHAGRNRVRGGEC